MELFNRIKYIGRPWMGLKRETDLYGKACQWIGQDVPEDAYFQVKLKSGNDFGIADQCFVEVFQNNISLGTFNINSSQSVHDVVTFT